MFKMRKNTSLIIFTFILLILGAVNISAICCEKLKDGGMWCQAADNINACDAKYKSWYKDACSSVPECTGTCVNLNTGQCSEYTPKTLCLESGGSWSQNSIEKVPACQEICCVIGLEAYFINEKECKNMFSDFGIQGEIKREITTREMCELNSIALNEGVGACVISTETEVACVMKTNTGCTNSRIDELSGHLKNSQSYDKIEIRFHKGLLCTASINGVGLSDCAPTKNTICHEGKVYYLDSCGNLANIYDSSKYNNANYWTHFLTGYDENLCKVGVSGSATCGNCDSTLNTVCRGYREAGFNLKPSNNDNGLVCGDLSCKYNGKTYQHGESWCAESPGTLLINQNLTTGELFTSDRNALKNVSKYNLPGSRYYKMYCSSGEVIVEECADYRNAVCIQGIDDYSKRSQASCVFNPWMGCTSAETKTQCENLLSLCKWIPGYRWDGETVPEEYRKEMQGSCVPLIPPGFDFWNGTSSKGFGICAMGGVIESALYETPVYKSRKSMTEWTDGELAARCVSGCYAIPGYGKEFPFNGTKIYPEDVVCSNGGGNLGTRNCPNLYSLLTEFYDESEFKLPNVVSSYTLSLRRGQYCTKDGKPNKLATGRVTGQAYDCTPVFGSEEKDERKERDYPIYLTNQEFIMSITERAKSLGDCGYKTAVNGKQGNPESELITSIFQKLKQSGEVKKNVTVEQIIYKGDKYLTGDLERYETTLPISESENGIAGNSDCFTSYGGMCVSTINNPNPCTGGEENTGAVCPANRVCCVYPED